MSQNVYVLLPGITGSILTKDGKDVFGLTAAAGLRALFTGGNSLQSLKVEPTMSIQDRPDDGVTASAIAPDAHLIPGLWKIDGYGKVADYIIKRLKAKPGENYFEFPYDWRLDNRIAAHDLFQKVHRWLTAYRTGHPQAKVVLVAHSMGGLVARYYLEVLQGWRDTRALITFGTPHRGSLNALDALANGITKLYGLVDLTDLVRSFPSVYQLLPIYPCIDTGSAKLAYPTDVASQIKNLDVKSVQSARTFHDEIDKAVTANGQLEEYQNSRYRLHSVIGIEHPTMQAAQLQNGKLSMSMTHASGDWGGDGTVPRVAATPLEISDDSAAKFAATRHSSLQNAGDVLTQLRGWVSGTNLDNFKAGGLVRLEVDLRDIYPVDEPIHVTVTPSTGTARIDYRLEQLATPQTAKTSNDNGSVSVPPIVDSIQAVDGPNEIDIPNPGPGLYRMTLSGTAEVEPVSDLVVCAPR
ncbi:hypothetical protein ACH9D2_06645 [Kocuria sp. M4R2S49]|uniref:lipase/acyltransferase domain-containing protein n=1 Tax=Kocuria rhizosphaericola TaxID=3376284 RepID=UPI0037898868